jgi:apolipoprotein N-acyltransferase
MRRFWPWLCAILSGALLTLCYPPANLGGLSWLALTPLICALWFSEPWKNYDGLRLLLLGYAAGLVYMLGSLHWLINVTILGWVALCLFLGLYTALWAPFVGSSQTAPVSVGSQTGLVEILEQPAHCRARRSRLDDP